METRSSGDREGGGPWRRRGAAATVTGRAADLGSDGERLRRGGLRTLAATGSGRDGEGGDGERRRRGGQRTLAAMGGGGDGKD
jgi:hypothetical protein